MDTIALVVVRALVIFVAVAVLFAIGLSFLNSRLARSMEESYRLERQAIERRAVVLRTKVGKSSASEDGLVASREIVSADGDVQQSQSQQTIDDSPTALSKHNEHRIISVG